VIALIAILILAGVGLWKFFGIFTSDFESFDGRYLFYDVPPDRDEIFYDVDTRDID